MQIQEFGEIPKDHACDDGRGQAVKPYAQNQKISMQHHSREGDYSLPVMIDYGHNQNHGQLVKSSVLDDFEDHGHDTHYRLPVKAIDNQNLSFAYELSDNDHDSIHNPTIINDYDHNQDHDKAMIVYEV